MELVKIVPENIKTTTPGIRVSSVGYIGLNTGLTRAVDIREGDMISFYQDKSRPKDWYFRIEKDGVLQLRQYKGTKGGLCCNSSEIAKKIIRSLDCGKRSVGIKVSVKPDEKGFYAILTSSVQK